MARQEYATKLADKLKTRLRHAFADASRYEVWAKPRRDYSQIQIQVRDRKTGKVVTSDRSLQKLDSDSEIRAFVADLVGEIKKSGD